MPQLSVETTAEGVAAALGILPSKVHTATVRAMTRVGLMLVAELKKQVTDDGPAAMHVRTGTGRRSMFYRVELDGTDGISTVAGADLTKAKYMRLQNDGGTITPKSSKFLTIPLDAVKTGNGVSRFTARQVIANPSAYGYTGTFFKGGILFGTKRGGQLRGVSSTGGRGKSYGRSIEWVPLFALRPFVKIPAHHFMENALAIVIGPAREEVERATGEATS